MDAASVAGFCAGTGTLSRFLCVLSDYAVRLTQNRINREDAKSAKIRQEGGGCRRLHYEFPLQEAAGAQDFEPGLPGISLGFQAHQKEVRGSQRLQNNRSTVVEPLETLQPADRG